MVARGMVTVARLAGNEEGNGEDAGGGGMMVAMPWIVCEFLSVWRDHKK
jgi:hypothetical protein